MAVNLLSAYRFSEHLFLYMIGSLLPGVDMIRYSYENHSLEDLWVQLLDKVQIRKAQP